MCQPSLRFTISGSAVPLSACSSRALAMISRSASGTSQWSRIFSTFKSNRAGFAPMTPIFTPVRGPGTGPTGRTWLQSEATAVGAMALGVLVLHLATNGQYDFHRDSLYYMDSARHPAWGYVDYPPVTPTIARLSLWLFGPSVWGLRLWPTLCGAAMVVICYLIARELGAGRFGRLLAAAGAATSLVLLGANWLFQTVTFDQVVWLTALYLLARLVRTGDQR